MAMGSLFSCIGEPRPRMDVHKSKKGKEYHAQMGRADRASVNTGVLQRMYAKSILAEKAYNDEIWTNEDVDTFLLDESLNTRNRVKFSFNMIKPIVEQLRGGAIQTDFSASVQPVTKHTRTVRQMGMAQQQLMHSLSEMSPEMDRIIRSSYNLGDTMQQSVSMLEDTWQDNNTKAMNHLLQQMVALNEMDRFRGEDAYRFSMSGVLAEILRKDGSHVRWHKIHPRDFFYDTSAQMMDFSDAAFMGSYQSMTMPQIAEMWNVSESELSDIESSIRAFGGDNGTAYSSTFDLMSQTKVKVLSDYWNDVAYDEWGYVNGEGGVPTMVRIGDDDGRGPLYTLNDVIEPPVDKDGDLFKGNRTRKSFTQCTRFVEMVMWEDMAGRSTEGAADRKRMKQGEMPDLILDHGVYDLQEYNPYDVGMSRSPVKACCFALAKGEIVSPVQAVIDPNRFVNRILSALEGQMNASGGKTLMIDLDMVDKSMGGINSIDSRVKQGKSIAMRANGRGVSTAMGSHDDSPGAGAYAMLQIVSSVQDLVRTVTGVHAPMMGEGQKDAMVGVTEILVQRGAIMQEPFYAAYADLQLQKYKCMATAGKEFYLQHPDVLMDLVSQDDLVYLYQTREFEAERYNATMTRDNPERIRRQQANTWLDALVQGGLVDAMFYAQYYNSSYVEDIRPALIQYTAELQQAENAQRKEDAKQQIMAGLAQQAQAAEDQQYDLEKRQMDSADMMAKEGAKEKANISREEVKGAIEKERMEDEAINNLI